MNDAFTDANESLRESLQLADEMIRGLKLGVAAAVELPDGSVLKYDQPDGPQARRRLYVERDGKVIEVERLDIAGRESVADAIPQLIDVLGATRAGRGFEIQATADRLDAYLDGIGSE